LEEHAGGKILGHDLFLYVRQPASVWGVDNEYISAPALDDLQCAWGCLQGFLNAEESGSVPMYCVFDSEEVGSRSVSGADSTMLTSTMNRIARYLDANLARMMAQSFLVSADNAHAIHPNHPELADPNNAPVMNGGIVVKFNASQRYTTDAVAAAVFRSVCQRAGVPTQTYYNRPDIPGGSTLGYVSLTHVSVPTADIGLAQLAMHSCYETAAVADAMALEDAMESFYGTFLEAAENGFRVL
jgi:aspartyl aminopeptidase